MEKRITNVRKNIYEKILQELTENNFSAKEVNCFSFFNKTYIIDKKKEKLFAEIAESFYTFFIEKSIFSAILGIGAGIFFAAQVPKCLPTPVTEGEKWTTTSTNTQNEKKKNDEIFLQKLSLYQKRISEKQNCSLSKDTFENNLKNYTFTLETIGENTKDIKTVSISEEVMNRIYKRKSYYRPENFISTTREEIENIQLHNKYIKEYCEYFNFDSEKVISLALSVTNNYQDFETVINNDAYVLDNIETNCLIFIYTLKRDKLNLNWKELGCTLEDFKINKDIRRIPKEHIETITLDNGYGFTEYIGKIADLFKIDRCIPLTICFCETGGTPKNSAWENNNFFGMKPKGPTGDFLFNVSPEAGIISAIENLARNYNTIKTTKELANQYSSGDKNISTEETEGWLNNFTFFYNKIKENEAYYFGNDKNEKHYFVNTIKEDKEYILELTISN